MSSAIKRGILRLPIYLFLTGVGCLAGMLALASMEAIGFGNDQNTALEFIGFLDRTQPRYTDTTMVHEVMFGLSFAFGSFVCRRQLRASLNAGIASALGAAIKWAVTATALWTAALYSVGHLELISRAHLITGAIAGAAASLSLLLAARSQNIIRVSALAGTMLFIGIPVGFLLSGRIAALQWPIAVATLLAAGLTVAASRCWSLTRASFILILTGNLLIPTVLFVVGGTQAFAPDLMLKLLLFSVAGLLSFILLARLAMGRLRLADLVYTQSLKTDLRASCGVTGPHSEADIIESEEPSAWIFVSEDYVDLERVQCYVDALRSADLQVVLCRKWGAHEKRSMLGAICLALPEIAPFRRSFASVLALAGTVLRTLPRSVIRRSVFGSWIVRADDFHSRVAVRSLLRRRKRGVRISLVLCLDTDQLGLAEYVRAREGAKLVVDLNDYSPERFFNDKAWLKKNSKMQLALLERGVKNADSLIVSGNNLARKIASTVLGMERAKVARTIPRTMPGLVPLNSIDSVVVRWLGDIIDVGDVSPWLDAVAFLDHHYKFCLEGEADRGVKGELKRRIEFLGLGERVVFRTPAEPLASETEGTTHISIFNWRAKTPSYFYSLPPGLFEEAASGRAIIAVGEGELDEVFKEFDMGAITMSGDAETLAAIIRKIAEEWRGATRGPRSVTRQIADCASAPRFRDLIELVLP